MRLIGKPTSINVRKVLWTCAAIGLPAAPEPWGSEHPGLLALNPNNMVPVIVDDGLPLWESNTICRYLAGKHGRSDLLPSEAMARAQVEQWMDWQATELNNAWRYAFMGLVRANPAYADAQAIAASAASWNRHMALLDRQLEGRNYVAGESFTLADIVLGLSTNRWLSTPIERPALAHVAAWYARLAAQPGFAEHCANGVP